MKVCTSYKNGSANLHDPCECKPLHSNTAMGPMRESETFVILPIEERLGGIATLNELLILIAN